MLYFIMDILMTQKRKVSLFKKTELFKNLSGKDLENIINLMKDEHLPSNTVFIEEGTIGDKLYFITNGLVSVFRTTEEGKEVTITMRKPGEVVGEMALIDDNPRSASARTLQKTQLLTITKVQFINLLYKHPSIGITLLKTLSERIRENVGQIENFASNDLTDRTKKVLLTLAPHFENKDIFLSQEQISLLVGATRPRVTEALNNLALNGFLTLSSKKIHVN